MTRFGVRVALAGTLLATSAFAADVTRVASSLEDDDPFGMFVSAEFERTQQRATVLRESHGGGGDVRELQFSMLDSRLNVGLQVGIYKDLEFRFRLPIVFQQDRHYRFAAGTDASNSTIAANCLAPDGTLLNASCPTTGAGAQPLFNVPTDSYRRGLDNMSFGLAYAIFNQKKDDTKPTWVIGFDWEVPSAEKMDPTVSTTSSSQGKIGDRTHKYTPYTAFSRRFGAIEPYVKFAWTIPYRGPGAYSNCEHPNVGMGYPQNCDTVDWPAAQNAIRMPQVLAFTFGTDLIADEDAALDQRFGFDVRGIANYFTKGRYQNELTDVLGKLLATGDFLQVGGRLGVLAKPARAVSLRVGASFLYTTDHTLTDEIIGKDSSSDTDDQVSVPQIPGGIAPDMNPNFDFRTDMVSRRFFLAGSYTFTVDASLSLEF